MREQTQQAAARGDAAVTPLADLEFIPFLDKDGKFTKLDSKGVKASVFAVYDEVRRGCEIIASGQDTRYSSCGSHAVVFSRVVCFILFFYHI